MAASHATTARLLEVASALFGGEECEAEEVQYITKAPHTTYQFPLHQDNACAEPNISLGPVTLPIKRLVWRSRYGQFWEP